MRPFLLALDFGDLMGTLVAHLNTCLQDINWVALALIILFGSILTIHMFTRRSITTRALAWNILISTVFLAAGVFLHSKILCGLVIAFIAALVVIYQPEFREALIKVSGPRAMLASKHPVATVDHYHELIKSVCEATIELSRSKTGALIVLERRVNLDHIVESGVVLDAAANDLLFRNIFFNRSPLHDCAVVVRNCRILAARCTLPLSNRNDLGKDIGTRHRAAIGMSEASDAIVIVVSEETGTISVAYRAQLTREYTYQSLHAFLTKVLLQEGTDEDLTANGND